MTEIIIGWKSIAKHLDCSVETARKYHKVYGMPIFRLPSHRPVLDPDRVMEWIRSLPPEIPKKS